MIIAVDKTTWIVFCIISFILLSFAIFGKIIGFSTATGVLSKITKSVDKTTKKTIKKKK